MNYKIVSGYTKNTPYEKEINNLRISLKQFGFTDEHLVPFENKGTWEKNCQYKAYIIKEKLKQLNTPVVWLDADAVLKKSPDIFCQINEDLGLCFYRQELMSGTLFFKPTENNFKLLDEWIKLNNENPQKWDQKVLQQIVNNWKINYYKLPLSYCKIDYIKTNEIVIGQNQASRRFKKIINKK